MQGTSHLSCSLQYVVKHSLAMETLRVYRPRIILHGPSGMGQAYVGAAVLHHLEGYHIQTLDLGSIMGDSTRVCCIVVITLKIFLNKIWCFFRPWKHR